MLLLFGPASLPLNAAPWCSGLTRLPVKEEIGSSNLLGVATSLLPGTELLFHIIAAESPTLFEPQIMELFEAAHPFADDVLALPVTDIDEAARWYASAFGLQEVERRDDPVPTVIMERDGARIGFAINGGDASQDGAAILVSDIQRAKDEIENAGVETGNWRVDERDGQKLQVFFVIAPDRLCYYFHQPID